MTVSGRSSSFGRFAAEGLPDHVLKASIGARLRRPQVGQTALHGPPLTRVEVNSGTVRGINDGSDQALNLRTVVRVHKLKRVAQTVHGPRNRTQEFFPR